MGLIDKARYSKFAAVGKMNRSPARPVYSDYFSRRFFVIREPPIGGNSERVLASRVSASYDSEVGFAIK